MKITAELSLYPLATEYLPRIESFIRELEAAEGLEIVVNQMSTQVSGELGNVVAAVRHGLEHAFGDGVPQVLVVKFLNAALPVESAPDRVSI